MSQKRLPPATALSSGNIEIHASLRSFYRTAQGGNGLVDIDMAALKLARLHDVRTVLNVSPFDATSAKLCRFADVVIANHCEWAKLSNGEKDPEAMRTWSRWNNQILVVTKGAGGVSAPQEYFEVAAPAIEAIDTVGAGDTFCGYFAAQLDRGSSLREATEIAVVAASIACLQAGAQPSIPMRVAVPGRWQNIKHPDTKCISDASLSIASSISRSLC